MTTKIFTPINLILAGLFLLVLAQFGIFTPPTLSTVDLIDPSTNQTFTCTTTFDCYDQIQGQLSDTGPALACVSGECLLQNCAEGDSSSSSCPDGTIVVLRNCVEGEWEFTNNVCVVECDKNSQCIGAVDKTCDGELDPDFGQCVNSQCKFETTPRCGEAEIFFNKYKFHLIAGAIFMLGLGGFIFRTRLSKIF